MWRSLGSVRKDNVHLESFNTHSQGPAPTKANLSCTNHYSIDAEVPLALSSDLREFICRHSRFAHYMMRRSDNRES